MGSSNLTNATAIGSGAAVTASNSLVLGQIAGVGGAQSNTNVGIGTTAPGAKLEVDGPNQLDVLVQAPYSGVGAGLDLNTTGSAGAGTQWEILDTGATAAQGANKLNIRNVGLQRDILTILQTGNVGIGTTSPTNLLTVQKGGGAAIADGWSTYSSRRWKTNIQTLHGALAKVEQLRGVSYDLKDSGKHEVGVIAEEVAAVVPEIVSWDKNGKDAQGVDYSRLTALLIEAVKQQQREIASQRALIGKLRDKDARQTRALQTVGAQMALLQSQFAQLAANVGELRQANRLAAPSTAAAHTQIASAGSVTTQPR